MEVPEANDAAAVEVSVEEQLYYATKMGDLPAFETLFQQHPFLVDQVLFAGSRNLLHIATMGGRESMVVLLLEMSPQLAREVDDKRSSSLHIAAAQGHTEIARRLFSTAPEMCWRVDDQGMNPVHVAAANGHVGVLELLLEDDSSPGMELLEGRRNVLALSVKHRQLPALRFLVDKFPSLLHDQDADGETILSFALSTISPRPITAMIRDVTGMTSVVMGLIAAMAQQASLSPPGGVWQDDMPSHKAGKAVVASTDPGLYKLFYRANDTAFISSLLVIFLITISAPKTSFIYTVVILLATIVAIGAIALGYGTAMIITNPVEIQPVRQVIATVGAGFKGILLLAIAMATLKISYTKWKEQKLQHEDRTITDRIFRVYYRLHL